MSLALSGAIYVNSDTAVADTARRFATSEKKVKKAYITVTTKDQLFGTSASQVFTVAAGGTIYLEEVDLSTLYFKNAAAGQNGTVAVLAVEI
jgi:hypothetical protein